MSRRVGLPPAIYQGGAYIKQVGLNCMKSDQKRLKQNVIGGNDGGK